MSIFMNIQTLSFSFGGVENQVKDIRYLPEYKTGIELAIGEDDKLDEIACRKEIYGEEAEGEFYRIFEANAAKLIDNECNMSGIKSLFIPSRVDIGT